MREVKVATKPVAILAVLTEEGLAIERIGLEAGPLSQWLFSALAEAGLPVICVETRHMRAVLKVQINFAILARDPEPILTWEALRTSRHDQSRGQMVFATKEKRPLEQRSLGCLLVEAP